MKLFRKICSDELLPKTSSGGQILGFKMSKSRGEKLRQNKAEKKKEEKLRNMKIPHVFVGVSLGQFKL